jgi:hypothetical protein
MIEFELYVPVLDPGSANPALDGLKDRLRERFGGYTYFPQESQGEWQTGGQRFKDRIVILRILTDDQEAVKWFQELRRELAVALNQTDFLITAKPVQRVEALSD